MNNRALFLGILGLTLISAALTSCSAPKVTPADQLQTPQYTLTAPPKVDFEELKPEEIHTAEQGVAVIAPKQNKPTVPDGTDKEQTEKYEKENVQPENPMLTGQTPETVWENDETVTYNAFTLPEKAQLNQDGCVGILSIPAISLNMNIYEAADEMEAMLHGGAHYKNTSAWDGNIGVSAHVSGVPDAASFGNLHKLQKGDTICYQTALGERTYVVSDVVEVADDDWSYLSRTPDNRITLTTCITGQPTKRLLVQAVQQ